MKRFTVGARFLAGAVGLSTSAVIGGVAKEKYQRDSSIDETSANLVSKARLSFHQFFQLKAEATISTIEKLAIKPAEEKPCVIFVLGGPGSGKGTQCAKISDHYGYVHLSAGDLLRAERAAPGSKFGDIIQDNLKNGTLVPTSITCSLLERAMGESDTNNFLIDGFPRGEENLEVWNAEMGEKVDLQCVLFFHCSQEVCTKRCLARGAAGSGRSDDNQESLKKRFVTYEQATMPIIQQLEKLGLVRKIDASRSPEEVFDDVQTIMKDFV
jgi:UMP-CMP kinase